MARNKKTLNVALIGTKFMGRTHSNAFLKVSKFFDLPCEPVMHTVCARNPEETAAFAKRWGWQNASTDWEAVVNDPEIDLIDIGVPNNMHKDMAVAALKAGKHVACEKPLADTLPNARAMLRAAEKSKGKTFVWYNYRRCPAVAYAHQLAAKGKLGRIYHIRGFYLQDWGGPDTPMLWRFQGDVAGSGALGDLCAHSIDTTRFITGQNITEVSGAMLETFVPKRTLITGEAGGEISGKGASTAKAKKVASTVDDAVVFTCRFEGGAVATFEATRLSTGDKNGNRVQIHGEKGAVRFDFERMPELQWYDATLPADQQGWSTINVSDGDAGHPYVDAWWPPAHAIGYEHGFINQTADMIKAIAGKKPVVALPDFADAYETQKVLDAVTRCAKTGRTVKLNSIK